MRTQNQLAPIFLASVGERAQPPSEGDLEAALRAYVDSARAACPEFIVEDVDIVRHIGARSPGAAVPPQAFAGDVLLACACARGVKSAIRAFHERYRPVIERVLSRRQASEDVAADAVQIVFEKLLTAPPDKAPKIAEYRGTGPLRAWVATAAATTLLMIRRAADRKREQAQDSNFFAGLARNTNPELLLMRKHYKNDLEEALARSIARLTDRERTLLRLHLDEGLTIDQLGAMYQVNRATAARWLAAARKRVMTEAREELQTRLKLSDSECDSIIAMVRSDLHLSLARRLS